MSTETMRAFAAVQAAVDLSMTGSPAAWRMYRDSGAPISMIDSLYPRRVDHGGRLVHRNPSHMLLDACDRGLCDLTTLDEYVRGAVGRLSPEQQTFFYSWQPLGKLALAAGFDVEPQDYRLTSVFNMIRTVNAYHARWDEATSDVLVALVPIWFDICDIVLAEPGVAP